MKKIFFSNLEIINNASKFTKKVKPVIMFCKLNELEK